MSLERPLIGFSLFATGAHPQGWRLDEADALGTFDPQRLRWTVQSLESHGLDFILLGDRLVSIPDSASSRPFEVQRPEALTTAAFIAAITSRIGIVTTVNTTYSEPFNVARAAAQLDHLSGGRVGLNLVTGKNSEASQNFSLTEHADAQFRYTRADEYVKILRQLWASWDRDAIVADKASGIFLREGSVRPIDFHGTHFKVRGPLNIPRPLQGAIPIGVAGGSQESMVFGARHAEFRYMPTLSLPRALAARERVASSLEVAGRARDAQRCIEGFVPYVASTLEGAHELYLRVHRMAQGGNAALLAEHCGLREDALPSVLHRDAVGDLPAGEQLRGVLDRWRSATGREEASLDELARFVRREKDDAPLVGTGANVADYLEARYRAGVADAFVLTPPFMPGGLESFLQHVVPELRRRGMLENGPKEGTMFRTLLQSTPPSDEVGD